MKKIIAILCLVVLCCLCLASCNYDIIDTTYSYDYAIIELPGGGSKVIEIASWTDYDGEQLQIKEKDTGNVYLVSSFDCILVKGDYKDLMDD